MQGSIQDWYRTRRDRLYDNEAFRAHLLGCGRLARVAGEDDRAHYYAVLDSFLEEADLTVALLNERSYSKGDSLLEIGGGLGLVYGFLKTRGYDIHAIEPCKSGFDGYFEAAQELLRTLAIDATNFRPYAAADVGLFDKKFDVIFSNNVFEHIDDLEGAIAALGRVLSAGGAMIHNTVNYHVPYEPHFGIALIPFVPRMTQIFLPHLKRSALWRGLHFVTTSELRRICRRHRLHISFLRDRLRKTLARLDADPQFAERQRYFVPLYHILKRVGLLAYLDSIPVGLTTPIVLIITHKGNQ